MAYLAGYGNDRGAMTLEQLRECIAAVVEYALPDEMDDVLNQMREQGWSGAQALERHVARPLLALAEFIGQPATEACVWCGDERPWQTSLPGGICPHCGHLEPNENEEQ